MSYQAARKPTFYFIGVTTAKSSIMRVFPAWARHLSLGDVEIRGIDFEPHAEPARYREAVEFLKAAKAAGCITTLDLIQARPEVVDLAVPLMPYVDFFLPSIEETSAMVGSDDPETCARFFIEKGVGGCAISLGENGSFVMTRDGRQFSMPAFQVAVRDTSGCGDAYSGGFIAGLARDWDIEDCARLATATASIVATGLGSGANLKSFEDTVEMMKSLPVRQSRA